MNLTRTVVFSIIVLAWSYVFFQIRPIEYPEGLPFELYFTKTWLPALGLFFASLIFRPQLKNLNVNSLLGDNPKWSLVIAILPIIGLGIFGIPNDNGLNPHYFGIFLGFIVLLYALFEEFGWRGYLQQELQIDNEWIKYGIIGFLWYAWHWDFLGDVTLTGQLFFLVGLIFGSLGIGKIAEKTNSILVCATIHALGNIGFLYAVITGTVSFQNRMILVGVCAVAFYFIITQLWNKQKLA